MKQNRNDKCVCGSGIKYKKCCLIIEQEKQRQAIEKRRNMILRIKEAAKKSSIGNDSLMMALAMSIGINNKK